MNERESIPEASIESEMTVLIIRPASSFAAGRNLINPMPSPRFEKTDNSVNAAISVDASPIVSGEYVLVATTQKTIPRSALAADPNIR